MNGTNIPDTLHELYLASCACYGKNDKACVCDILERDCSDLLTRQDRQLCMIRHHASLFYHQLACKGSLRSFLLSYAIRSPAPEGG